ncbi:MAG: hypothetical protein ACT7A5_03465 [Ferrovibrionaceae bacterium]
MAKWFRKRTVGYGVSPQGAGGWLVTLVYVLALVGIAAVYSPATAAAPFLIGIVAASVVYGIVIFATLDRDG